MSVLTFREDTHQYFNERGEEYISATTFIKKFAPEFDQEGTAARVAAREGVTKEEISERWKQASEEACAYGTKIHLLMENYLKFGAVDPSYSSMYKSLDKILGRDGKDRDYIRSEYKLHNDEYMIAGTADLIIDVSDTEFLVGDFKTNKEIKFFDRFGGHLLEPVTHLSACNYNIYSLQLSLYGYFYGLETGKKCRNVFLMHCSDETEWKFIPANYMEYEVRAMLKKYNLNKRKYNENISAKN